MNGWVCRHTIRSPFLAAVLLVVAFPSGAGAEGTALVIAEGSLARRQVIALGRDLVIDGEALSDAVAVNGSVSIRGAVRGDVIALGGDVTLANRARVDGDIFVLGGRLAAKPGSTIGGRSVSYPSVGSAWLVLLEGPSLGLSPLSRVVLGAKLALLAAWLLWSTLSMATVGREVLSTSAAVRSSPFRMFVLGLAGVLSLFLTALFVSSWASSLVGVPLLFLVVLILVVLKLWGSVAVFHALGHRLVDALGLRWNPMNAAVTGLLILGALKLVPIAGTWIWTVVTLVGVGAALETKFGRREPWFQGVMPESV